MMRRNKDTKIYLHAQDGEWTDLIDRCESYPEEASFADLLGRTPLHRACSLSPPSAAVSALLAADESAVARADKDGKLPIHYAVSGASLDVVNLLAETHPHSLAAADGDLWTPLHCTCFAAGCCRPFPGGGGPAERIRALASAFPEALGMADDFGRTPLHLACLHGAPPDVILELLRLDGERVAEDGVGCAGGGGVTPLVAALDRRRHSPLHLSCCKYDASEEGIRTMEILLGADPPQSVVCDYDGRCCLEVLTDSYETPIRKALRSRKDGRRGSAAAPSVSGVLSVYWEKANLLIEAMSRCSFPNREDAAPGAFPLCDAIRLNGCPKSFIFLSLRIRPGLVYVKDPDGNLPLHVAAETVRGCSNSDAIVSDATDLTDVVEALLNLHPGAARVPNLSEKLPLQLAIESGKGWTRGIRAIYRAYPPALHSANYDLGLLPLFLATRIGAELTDMFLTLRSRPDILVKTAGSIG